MSSILLSNPFVPPNPAAQPSDAAPQSGLAVAPAQGASAGAGAGDSTAFSGRDDGRRDKSAIDALLDKARAVKTRTERPSEATADSVVAAQTQSDPLAEVNPFENKLPKVEMPHIIPTAHWLRDEK